LKNLEAENATLTKLPAESEVDNTSLKDLLSRIW